MGTYPVTVTITDTLTGASLTVNSSATVTPVPITITPKNFAVTGNVNFSGTIATFTDGDPRVNPAFYTATINWGDGTPKTIGTITGINPFTITASHTFASFQNTDLVTITVVDENGRTATAVDRVVDPPDVVSVAASPLVLEPNKVFLGTVATFTDSAATEPASAYTATIDWGKGRKTAGMITGGDAQFIVTARHKFPKFTGSKTITVTVTDAAGVTVSETASYAPKQPKAVNLKNTAKKSMKHRG